MTQTTSPVLFAPLLLATDGSASARSAQAVLATIARVLQPASDAHLSPLVAVLTVQPRPSSRSPRLLRARPSEATDPTVAPRSGEAESLSRLAEARSRFPETLSVSLQARQGQPAIEILNHARAIGAGLIAVGNRGTGGMRELLLGSVSAVIARYAPCSVLVARGAIAVAPELRLHHVLLVVDGTAASRDAIATTRQLIPAGIQQVTILCVQLPINANYLFGPFVTPTPSWQLNQSLQAAQKAQAEEILQQAQQAIAVPNLEVQTLTQTSEPGPLICQIAQQRQADLIILGSDATRRSLPRPVMRLQNRAALRNTRLSPTEDYTIHHAPCPVLLCRQRQPSGDRSRSQP